MAIDEDPLAAEVRMLKKTVSSMHKEQEALRRQVERLDVTAKESGEHYIDLEERVGGLERERSSFARSMTNFTESLSARVTELGVEVVQFPPAQDLHEALRQLEVLAEASDRLDGRVQKGEQALEVALEQTRSDIIARTCSQNSELAKHFEENFGGLHSKAEELGARCDGLATDVQALRGRAGSYERCVETKVDKAEHDLIVARCSSVSATLEALSQHVEAVAKDLHGHLETKAGLNDVQQLRKDISVKAEYNEMLQLLSFKADVNHTHDRLVALDGSATFAI